MKLAAIVAAALLLLVTFAIPPGSAATTNKVLTISTATAGPDKAFKAFDGHTLKLFDFDGDGDLEIVGHNDNRRVYVFDSHTGQILAELDTRYPGGWGARSINAPEAAILVQGGETHLIIANSAAYITSFRFDPGGSSSGHFAFTKLWERRLDDCHGQASMDAKPVLHDLDGDGDLEILGATEEVGVFALQHNGGLMWKKCIGGGNAAPAVADMNFDGIPEVVWASDGGVITVTNGLNGGTQWSFWAGNYDLGAASIPVGPTIGQVDGIGPLDVVFGARDSHDAEDFTQNHAALFAVSGWGGLLWMRQDPGGAPLTYTHPIIVDIDSDGQSDIFWADWNTVGHKPPYPGDTDPAPWAPTGPAHFYRYDGDGNLRWRQSLDTYWNNKDLAIADVDGDGVQEVLANGPGSGGDGIWYLNALTGAKETFISVHPWKVTRGAVVEDLWDTGTMQWVVPVSAAASPAQGGAILVYDTHAPYNAAYPHLPYPSPGPGGGGGGGEFPATFAVSDSVNEWWVDVKVTSPQAVTSVTVTVNDGAPVALSKTSWGTWAKSVFVAEGSEVVFTARNSFGDTAVSDPIAWLGGTPPPSGDFEATFTVPFSINNWWVEVDVDASDPVASVTASVDGGPQKTLNKQSWGNWAKSFFVATGSDVVFTAKNNAGDTAVSPVFQWLGEGPPPPSGDLEATFELASGVNQYWVEVDVDANKPITGVDVIVDGSPTALSKTSWGNWAKSFYVPAGSSVHFEATDGSDTVTSDTYTWLVSGGDFDATFVVSDTANNWWVEARVDATQVVTSVTATVDGGSPRALSTTSWGTWAKSFFVPDGATVVFQAGNGSETITSGPYTWG